MDAFVVGLIVGVALGVVIIGFLAIGAYERGFSSAIERRKAWRGELVARQQVARRVLDQMRKAS